MVNINLLDYKLLQAFVFFSLIYLMIVLHIFCEQCYNFCTLHLSVCTLGEPWAFFSLNLANCDLDIVCSYIKLHLAIVLK